MPQFVPPSAIALDQIRETMFYDYLNGDVVWNYDNERARAQAGDPVGYVRLDGKRVVYVYGRILYVHQIAAFLRDGEWPTKRVWFVDRDPRNLKPENLSVSNQHPHSVMFDAKRKREEERNRANNEAMRKDGWALRPGWKDMIEEDIARDRAGIAEAIAKNDSSLLFQEQNFLRGHLRTKLAVFSGNPDGENDLPPMTIEQLEARIELFS